VNYATGELTDVVIERTDESGPNPFPTGQWIAIEYATPNPPAIGATPTIDYVSGGWGSGTGIADEDGTCPARGGATCWMPTTTWNITSANANMQRDLDYFLQHYAAKAYSSEKAIIQTAIPGILLFCNSGGYGTPARAPVLRAMGEHCDVALGSSDFSTVGVAGADWQARYDYMIEHLGDHPIGSWEGFGANLDSHLAAADLSNTSPEEKTTQAARGTHFALMLNTALTTKDSTYDAYHFVAWKWWALYDTPGEGYNWGFLDAFDNAYDGVEATTGSHACSAPLAAYTCGGEAADYGDAITPIKAALAGMWQTMLGGVTPASSMRGGTMRGGTVR
jgi:hypothetical protein